MPTPMTGSQRWELFALLLNQDADRYDFGSEVYVALKSIALTAQAVADMDKAVATPEV